MTGRNPLRLSKLLVATALSIGVFLLIAAGARFFIYPRLPTGVQTDIVWVGGAFLLTLTVLAGVAQITGFSLRDFAAPAEQSEEIPQDTTGDIVMAKEEPGRKIELGDIQLDRGSQLVISQGDAVAAQGADWVAYAERLIRDIQADLYGDDHRLPYVLTLCLDLCDRLGLTDEYERWLRIELNGIDDYEEFQKQFANDDAFIEWMGRWGSHRRIKTYVKFSYLAEKMGRREIDRLPFRPVVIPHSVGEIARTIEGAGGNPGHEFSTQVSNFGEEFFEEIRKDFATLPNQVVLPDDLKMFYTVAELESILNGVREHILELLSTARQKTV